MLIDDGRVRLHVEHVEAAARAVRSSSAARSRRTRASTCRACRCRFRRSRRRTSADLEFALELGVDFVALSFVRSAADVRDLRSLIEQAGSHAHVIAKIEKAEAVDVLDDVLAETDAVMVARGDLGVEIGAASVPLLQKRIIQKALERGKPVITATQMLESMI